MRILFFILITLLFYNTSTAKPPKEETEEISGPIFKDGYDDVRGYIYKNLHYPEAYKDDSIHGIVMIKFVINTDGSTKEPVVLKTTLGGLFIDEAIRVINTMPKWKPATRNGKPVEYYKIPTIAF